MSVLNYGAWGQRFMSRYIRHYMGIPPAAVSSLSNLCCLSCSKSGYGGVTGGHDPGGPPYFSRDGLLCDCLGVAGLDDVLCYAWRGDNYGPATLAEVELNYQKFG